MAIRYTITNYSCPHCGKVFKTDSWSQLGYLLLIVGTAFLSLSWFLSIAIMRAMFGSSNMPSIGSPFRTCEHCGKKFLSYEHQEWNTLNTSSKKIWSYRLILRFLYALSGFVPLFLLSQFFWGSNHESDRTIALVFLILAILIVLIIAIAYYFWRQYEQKNEIILNQADFDIVKESLKRTGDDLNLENPPLKVKDIGVVYGVSQQKNIKEPTHTYSKDNEIKSVFDILETNENSNYGYSVSNPIMLSSIPEEYSYLSSLVPKDINKMIIGIDRKGSVSNGNGLLDLWEITVIDYNSQRKETIKIYINPYATRSSFALCPKDFKLK